MPQSKCKRNQRKTLHTHAKKKKSPGKIHPRKKKADCLNYKILVFHLAFASLKWSIPQKWGLYGHVLFYLKTVIKTICLTTLKFFGNSVSQNKEFLRNLVKIKPWMLFLNLMFITE